MSRTPDIPSTPALPPAGPRARFAPEFGRRVLLTVDTEEEFDWTGPFTRDRHGLDHLPRLRNFQEFCESHHVVPSYLVDWPVATSTLAKDILAPAVASGKAEVGIQLHPWVNPPFEEEVNARNSYAGNLPLDLERAKFLRLRDAIAENFGANPQLYRAGRYGFGPATAELLRDAGVAIDSSFRPLFDYRAGNGPDFSGRPSSSAMSSPRIASSIVVPSGVIGIRSSSPARANSPLIRGMRESTGWSAPPCRRSMPQ